jgi:hypothetical protein
LTVGPQGLTEVFNLNAGGMALRAAISSNNFLPNEAVSFQIFPETVEDFETARPLARDVDEQAILVVPAGRYTVVSRYGDVNAIVRAQIDVEPGQLTEAVMFHNAAQITLKLVNEPNGEALPNTAWSVLNPGGDIVREFVGAFPTMVLSEGDYTIIARHDGQVSAASSPSSPASTAKKSWSPNNLDLCRDEPCVCRDQMASVPDD